MRREPFLSITNQVADRLRAEILRGRWTDTLPGKHQLAAELGVNNKTVESAIRQLEADELLIPQGAGRRRRINPEGGRSSRALRVAILTLDLVADRKIDYLVDLHHSLSEAGHTAFYARRSLTELRFDLVKIEQLVEQTKADAWVIVAGSREVLECQRQGLRLPGFGPDKVPACVEATRKLLELGHHRIVLLCRRIRRLPTPGLSERAFLAELQAGGVRVGDYNLPDWEESDCGFQKCLDALFRVTPPTALIIDEIPYFVAALQFMAFKGIRVPSDVSLICTDDDPAFDYCEPRIACMRWDPRPLVRRVLQWADNVSRGKQDLRQTVTPSTFVFGGTVANVPGKIVNPPDQ
jgi:hypothetical protein